MTIESPLPSPTKPAGSIYGVSTDEVYTGQPPFGTTASDSLQYELFFDQIFVSIRIIKTPTATFSSAWMWDNGIVDLLTSYQPFETRSREGLYAGNDHISYAMQHGGGQILIRPEAGGEWAFDIEEKITSQWRFPPDDVVIHQPGLRVSMRRSGETLVGRGYAKRYAFAGDNGYMYWRFITGPFGAWRDQTGPWVWTAEAAFELKKYDYFKIMDAAGDIKTADQPGTYHRDRLAIGVVDGQAHCVEIEDIGRIEKVMKTDKTDMKISQAYCHMTVTRDGETLTGFGLNEIACGTNF